MIVEVLFAVDLQDWVLRAQPSLPAGLCWIVAIATAALIVWLYLGETGEASRRVRCCLAAIRATVVGLVLFLAQGWSIQPFITQQPELIVVVDNSRSMSIVDEAVSSENGHIEPPRSRLEQAREELLRDDRLATLWSRYQLRLHTLYDHLDGGEAHDLAAVRSHLESLDPEAESSPIASRIRELLDYQRGRSTAAVLVWTDGNSTDHESLDRVAQRARRMKIPIFAVGIGRESLPLDLEVSELFVDRTAFLGDMLTFDATLKVTGGNQGQALVRLERDDMFGPLQEENVEVRNGLARVRMSHRVTEIGTFTYRIAVERFQDEVDLANNQDSAQVEIMDESVRVLLVGSVPSYEFRHLALTLARAANPLDGANTAPFQLATVLQDADAEFHQVDASEIRSFPEDREQLLEYDVVVLCDADPNGLPPGALENLVHIVSHEGRGVAAIAGPRYMPHAYLNSPAAALLPVTANKEVSRKAKASFDTPLRVQLAPLGAVTGFMQIADSQDQNSQTWSQLPPVYWSMNPYPIKPSAHTLATLVSHGEVTADEQPVFLLHYFGSGRCLYHATDETHRWLTHKSGEGYKRYWAQAVRFLGRGRLGSRDETLMTADRRQFGLQDGILLRVDFATEGLAPESDSGVTVVLDCQLGRRQRVELRRTPGMRHRYETLLDTLTPGHYRAWLEQPDLGEPSPSCEFKVTSDSGEMRSLTVNEDGLRKAASLSGGRYFPLAQTSKLLAALPRGTAERVESLSPLPIWNWWGWALACVALLCTEWLLRKKFGML